MSARGIKVNHDGDGGHSSYSALSYAAWTSTDFLDFAATSCCGSFWVRVKGASGGSDGEGHTAFNMPRSADFYGNGGIQVFSNDATAASPWSFRGRAYPGTVDDQNLTTTAATDEDWYFAFSSDATADQVTWFWAKDGDVSLSSVQSASGLSWGAHICDGVYLGGVIASGNHKGANIEITNVKFWTGVTMDASAMLAEMKSEAVISTSGLHSHWKLASASDLSDYSGNSHTLSLTGTVTDGTMDPVDIQGSSGSTCTFYGRLIA